jgi:hypothetical protein
MAGVGIIYVYELGVGKNQKNKESGMNTLAEIVALAQTDPESASIEEMALALLAYQRLEIQASLDMAYLANKSPDQEINSPTYFRRNHLKRVRRAVNMTPAEYLNVDPDTFWSRSAETEPVFFEGVSIMVDPEGFNPIEADE